MNFEVLRVTLQSENRWSALRLRVVFDSDCRTHACNDAAKHNPIGSQFKKPVARYLEFAVGDERLHPGQRLAHESYSAASLAPLFLRFPPLSLASTGARNFPV